MKYKLGYNISEQLEVAFYDEVRYLIISEGDKGYILQIIEYKDRQIWGSWSVKIQNGDMLFLETSNGGDLLNGWKHPDFQLSDFSLSDAPQYLLTTIAAYYRIIALTSGNVSDLDMHLTEDLLSSDPVVRLLAEESLRRV